MLDMMAALALFGAGTETAQCTLQVEEDERRIEIQALQCPDDVSNAANPQSTADAIIARLNTVVRFRSYTAPTITRTVEFEYTDGRWNLPGVVAILEGRPRYPILPIQNGLQAICELAVVIGADGQMAEREVKCEAYNPDNEEVSGRGFHNSVHRAMRASRWLLPLGVEDACEETELVYNIGNTGQRPTAEDTVDDGPRCPT